MNFHEQKSFLPAKNTETLHTVIAFKYLGYQVIIREICSLLKNIWIFTRDSKRISTEERSIQLRKHGKGNYSQRVHFNVAQE